MATLTKHQQTFWDILQLPHIKDCDNCIHEDSDQSHVFCSYSNPCWAIGAEKNLLKDRPSKWKWDGKTY